MTGLLVSGVTILLVSGVALLFLSVLLDRLLDAAAVTFLRSIMALLLKGQTTVLLGYIVHLGFRDGVANLLIHGVAFLGVLGLAFLFVLGSTLLVILGAAFLFVGGVALLFWHIGALLFRHRVYLGNLDCGALFLPM